MATENAVYHYLDIGRLGRGGVLVLFLKDAGIDYKEVLYKVDATWPENKQKLREKGITRTGQLPALEYDGHTFSQHIPILRYFARKLGRYDGETNWEKYLVDAVADIYIDWRAEWVAAATKGEQHKNEYVEKHVPHFYEVVGQYYNDNPGPYLLGDKITYADFAVYHLLDNDRRIGVRPDSVPESLVRLEEAIEARPNLAEFIKQGKQ
ncbi:hypothetical protein VTN31DRAFT_6433 [Thermomyces dupontii]|uniref:uncharacterized protein n=1 Tax=Talaromyces thermophilus TaxID=28565 RepID=UPI003744508B